MRRVAGGLSAIVIATAIAGVAGYVITWLVFRQIGAVDYAVFAVFWSTTYLIVGTLSGVQQEITRATHPREPSTPAPRPVARNFAIAVAAVTAAALLAASPLWILVVFPVDGAQLVAPLVIAAAAYVLVAVLAGTLYGLSLWGPIAAMIILDGVLRLCAIAGVLAVTRDPVALAWAVALPFPVALAIVWPVVRRRIIGHNRLDVDARALTWNVARTILAAASTSVLVSGFPAILKLTSPHADAARLGVVVLAITLVRAPLIVSAMSLQSFLIVRLRPAEGLLRRVAVILAVIVAGGVVLSVAGWFLGPQLFLAFFGPEARVPAGLIAALVGSSVLVAALFVTGPALLSRRGHRAYTVGWAVAAVATVGSLLLPLPFLDKTMVALIAGPLLGMLVQGIGLLGLRSSVRSEEHHAV